MNYISNTNNLYQNMSISMPIDMKEAIRVFAKNKGVTMSEIVKEAVSLYLKDNNFIYKKNSVPSLDSNVIYCPFMNRNSSYL